jgi:hypothetical protein
VHETAYLASDSSTVRLIAPISNLVTNPCGSGINVNTTSVVSLEFNPVLEMSPEEVSTLEVRVREEGCWETESWAVALESGDARMYIADA